MPPCIIVERYTLVGTWILHIILTPLIPGATACKTITMTLQSNLTVRSREKQCSGTQEIRRTPAQQPIFFQWSQTKQTKLLKKKQAQKSAQKQATVLSACQTTSGCKTLSSWLMKLVGVVKPFRHHTILQGGVAFGSMQGVTIFWKRGYCIDPWTLRAICFLRAVALKFLADWLIPRSCSISNRIFQLLQFSLMHSGEDARACWRNYYFQGHWLLVSCASFMAHSHN